MLGLISLEAINASGTAPRETLATMPDTKLRAIANSADDMAFFAQAHLRDREAQRRAGLEEFAAFFRPILEEQLADEFAELADKRTAATKAAYLADLKQFQSGMRDIMGPEFDRLRPDILPISPEIVAIYVMHQAAKGMSLARIRRVVTAIGYASEVKQAYSPLGDPTVTAALKHAAKVCKRSKAH